MQTHELIRAQNQLGLKTSELARTLGVTAQTVSFWRCNRINVPGPVSLAIRLLMNMPAEQREQYIYRRGRENE
jgi:DNA-binding transcriptional regulator YiaG